MESQRTSIVAGHRMPERFESRAEPVRTMMVSQVNL
jgi:hypothetical protein